VDFGTGFDECIQYRHHRVSNQGEQQNLWPCWKLTHNAQALTQAVNPEARQENVNKLNGAENFFGSLETLSQSKNSLHCMKPKGSFACSQQPVACPHPQPDKFIKINIIDFNTLLS
jgi:hypothetical protein